MEEPNESEQVSEQFICAVCLDLLYKPTVLVCGHVTCFWCCHYSMDMNSQSHCPLCRHPYRHFPAICQLLDKFLEKMYPISYDKRKSQTLEDEEQNFVGVSVAVQEELNHQSIVNQPSHVNSEDKTSINNPPNNEENKSNDENCKHVTVADVLCAACNQLLFHPVVLNCGHVYCEACVTIPEDGVIKCQVCQSRHPSGFPKVCKELDCVLEERFPSEYALRKNSTQIPQDHIQNRNPVNANGEGSKLSYPTEENFLQWWTVHGSKFHPGAGCDMCGMYPIIGDRYQCKDCTEISGYDLCGDCHNTNSKLPGRFNQKHTQDHRLELVKPIIDRHVIHQLLSGQLAVVSAARNGTSDIASSSIDDDDDDGGGDNDNDDHDDATDI